jgi:hypothetical protein
MTSAHVIDVNGVMAALAEEFATVLFEMAQ